MGLWVNRLHKLQDFLNPLRVWVSIPTQHSTCMRSVFLVVPSVATLPSLLPFPQLPFPLPLLTRRHGGIEQVPRPQTCSCAPAPGVQQGVQSLFEATGLCGQLSGHTVTCGGACTIHIHTAILTYTYVELYTDRHGCAYSTSNQQSSFFPQQTQLALYLSKVPKTFNGLSGPHKFSINNLQGLKYHHAPHIVKTNTLRRYYY